MSEAELLAINAQLPMIAANVEHLIKLAPLAQGTQEEYGNSRTQKPDIPLKVTDIERKKTSHISG